jgi:hypothetical protein
MRPTWDQIQREAYARWERRGYGHGGDRDDWLAAEIDLTFDLNFETVAEVAEGESQLSHAPLVLVADSASSRPRERDFKATAPCSLPSWPAPLPRQATSAMSVPNNSRPRSIAS